MAGTPPPPGLDDFVAQNAPAAPAAQAPASGDVPDGLNDFIGPELQQQYGTPGQQLLTGAEGLAKGALGPIATGAEALLSKAGVPGLSGPEQEARAVANPWTQGLSETAGLVGPAIASAGLSAVGRAGLEVPEALSAGAKFLAANTQGGVLSRLGEAAVPIGEAAGIGSKGSGALAKIGSTAVRGAIENAAFQSGDELSKVINGDPDAGVQSAIPHVGAAALIGGLLGGGVGAVSSFWRQTLGTKTGQLLDAVANRVGGIEGADANPVQDMVSKLGFEPAPEIMASATDDPALKEIASVLSQSDTSKSLEYQEAMDKALQKAGETLSTSLGVSPENIPQQFDKYESGSKVLTTLADEAKERVAPIKAGYDAAAEKFSGAELDPSIAAKAAIDSDEQKALRAANKNYNSLNDQLTKAQTSGDVEGALELQGKTQDALDEVGKAQSAVSAPGTVDMLQDKVAKIASDMRLSLNPDSAASKAVASVQKELTNPEFNRLSDLSAYIKKISEKIPFNPFDQEGMQVSKRLKDAFRETEGQLIGSHIGSEEGQAALDSYNETRAGFSREAGIKEELEARLGKLGPTSSYEQRIREMAAERGEKGITALNGKNNADTLRLLQEHFPKTAEAVRQSLLQEVLSKAKDGEKISPRKILGGLEKLTPQQRALVIPGESVDRVGAIDHFLTQLEDRTHNWSNSGRTTAKLMQNLPGAALGLATMLMGHNPAVALVVGGLAKYIGRDAPDAIRLGMLKWMGSSKPIEAGAFKSMVDFIHSTSRGNSLMDNATRAIFKGASKVIPEHVMPNKIDTNSLDKKLKEMNLNPSAMGKIAPGVSYYMPDHGNSITRAGMMISNHLNSIRPGPTQLAPLDPKIEASDEAQAKYQRVLNLAQQPLMLLHHMNDQTLTPEDVGNVKAMMPGFYSALSQKITSAMIDHVSKGGEVPYETRQGLSILLGQPMDSSMSPQSIAMNQQIFGIVNQQEAAKAGAAKSKSSSSQVGMRNIKHADRISLDPMSDES